MKWLKVGAVVFASVVLTALGIDAADTMSGSRSTLMGQLISTENSGCPAGMIPAPSALTFSCVDIYEASAGPRCPYSDPNNQKESQANVNESSCQPVSIEDSQPWRFITRDQAVTACLRSGKRLISSEEWFTIAAGTPDTKVCNTDSGAVRKTGVSADCVSAVGAVDAIGNAWEWTNDDVIKGQYNGRSVPESGYVTQVDSNGFPTITAPQPNGIFYDDYFWSDVTGVYGILRGGFFGSKSDAGVYSVHAKTLPTNVSTAIGFRCVL